jgi:5-methylcytosine-specific restriction protein A
MPLRLKTRCRFPGCPRAIRGAFCDAHKGTYTQRSDTRRGTPAQRGYDATWAAVANVRRNLDRYLCQECLKHNRLTPSKTVDHIIPVHVRPDWRLALGNTQVICAPCHQQKTAEDTRRYGSSTQTTLTAQHGQNRREAMAMVLPRNEDDDGTNYQSSILTSNQATGG